MQPTRGLFVDTIAQKLHRFVSAERKRPRIKHLDRAARCVSSSAPDGSLRLKMASANSVGASRIAADMSTSKSLPLAACASSITNVAVAGMAAKKARKNERAKMSWRSTLCGRYAGNALTRLFFARRAV